MSDGCVYLSLVCSSMDSSCVCTRVLVPHSFCRLAFLPPLGGCWFRVPPHLCKLSHHHHHGGKVAELVGHRPLIVAARHRAPQHHVRRWNVADPHATTNMHVDVPCTREEEERGGRKEENDDPMPTSEREEDEEEHGGVDVPMEGPPDGDEDVDEEEEEPTEDPNVAKGGFTWRIPGFTVLKERKMYSETFQVGGYQWCERKRNEEKRRRNETIRYDGKDERSIGTNERNRRDTST